MKLLTSVLLVMCLAGCQDKTCSESMHIMSKAENGYNCPKGTKIEQQTDGNTTTVFCRCNIF